MTLKSNTSNSQWHHTETRKYGENTYFVKLFLPNSFEIRNEVRCLLSKELGACQSFSLPKVIDHSLDDGEIVMQFIEELPSSKILEETKIDCLILCASELYSISQFKEPVLRTQVSSSDYKEYLMGYVSKRLSKLAENGFHLEDEVKCYIYSQIQTYRVDYFSVVHRDLRLRHLLLSEKSKPYLVDWEFSNISPFAQDLSKLIYDLSLTSNNLQSVKNNIIKKYAESTGLSKDYVNSKVNNFMTFIPIEHAASLALRKPEGYKIEISRDMNFIKQIYDQR